MRWDGIGVHGSFWGALRDKGEGVLASTGPRGVKSGAVTRGCAAGGPRGDAAAVPGAAPLPPLCALPFLSHFLRRAIGFFPAKSKGRSWGHRGSRCSPGGGGGGGGCCSKAAFFLYFLKLYYDSFFFSGGCLCVFPLRPPSSFNPYNLNQKCRGEEGGERCVCRARPGVNLSEG